MRKQVQGRKFSRTTAVRKAFIFSLVRALFLHEKIETTEARAKELTKTAEHVITKAKRGDIAARRELAKHFDAPVVKKVVEELGKRYEGRPGGYTRIRKTGKRLSDSAPMVIVELV